MSAVQDWAGLRDTSVLILLDMEPGMGDPTYLNLHWADNGKFVGVGHKVLTWRTKVCTDPDD